MNQEPKPPLPPTEVPTEVSARWPRVEEVFLAALDLPPAERAAFLDERCAGDPEARAEVASLLDFSGRPNEAFEAIIQEAIIQEAINHPDAESAPLPDRFGPYRVLREIGRGGLGTVYLAERDDEHYRMQVVVKLVRRGLDTQDILERLRQERQILARLNHPNIARLIDGGETAAGRPYFVMEYIEGEPIDAWCDSRRLPIRRRLELFRTVCSAVQHAHGNLVIHRDLKPSNLLVTADGVPKLLDFGIAKLLDPQAAPALTTPGLRLLTPEYASPEQVRGEALTTATDVYSLGVLLYRLLTGREPYRFPSRDHRAIERTVTEAEPPRPSLAVKASERPERRLARTLAGDLDNLVLMALRKEPERRYASVEQLSEDVRRYLASEPLLARRDGLGYQLGKFLRRHRTAAAAAALVTLALLGGLAGTLWQRAEAERQRDRAEATLGWLVDVFKIADPGEARGRQITVREVLDRGARGIDSSRLDSTPLDRADLLDVMGRVYQNLGLADEAEAQLRKALALRRASLGDAHPEVASLANQLAEVLAERGAFDEAEALFREALEQRRRQWGDEHPEVAESLNDLGALYFSSGQLDEAAPLLERGLALRRQLLGPRRPEVAESLNNLAVLHYRQGDLAAAEEELRLALDIREEALGAEHPDHLTTVNNLAAVSMALGRPRQAEPLFRQALAERQRVLGEGHPLVADALSNLAMSLRAQGQDEAAAPLLEQALERTRESLGPDHLKTTVLAINLAQLREAQGETAEALRLYRQALDSRRRALPPGSWQIAFPAMKVGDLLATAGNTAEAEPLLREAVDLLRAGPGPDDWRTAEAESALAGCLVRDLSRRQEAEALLRHSLPILEESRRILETSLRGGEIAKARARLEALEVTAPHDETRPRALTAGVVH